MFLKKSSRVLIPIMLTICLLCSLFGVSCAPAAAPATSSPSPSVTVSTQPELQLVPYEQTTFQAPSIQNFSDSEKTNQALYEYFGSLVAALHARGNYELAYTLDVVSDSQLVLHSAVQVKAQDASLPLPDVTISSSSGVSLPDSNGFLPALSDEDFLEAGMVLEGQKISVDVTQYGNTSNQVQLLDFLTQAYESLSQKTIDDSNVVSEITNPVFRKAYALRLESYYGYEPESLPITNDMAMTYLSSFIKEFQGNEMGIASQTATVQDAIDLIEGDFDKYLIGQGSSVDGSEEQTSDLPEESAAPLPSTSHAPQESQPGVTYGRKTVDCTAIAQSASLALDAPLDRQTLAKLLVCIYETQTGMEIGIEPNVINFFDTEDEYCRKAVSASLMSFYPATDAFSPDLPICMDTLPQLIYPFVNCVLFHSYENFPDEFYRPLTYGQVVYIVAGLIGDYAPFDPPKLERTEVVNDRDYSWYYSQNDTGEYSPINCMPTCSAMAMKWQNPDFSDSVESLRNAYPENTMGWYMYDVENTLERYHVSYEPRDFFVDSELIPMMLEDLDQGCILFCQFNDHDTSVDGHCFIVYGYRKIGDSLWFLVNDPDGLGPDAFGKDTNQGKWVEGEYAQWIIGRFSTRYLSIDPIALS